MTTTLSFDPVWGAHAAEFSAGAYSEYLALEPASRRPLDHALGVDYALTCAVTTFALGADPDDARVWIKRAAFAFGELFRSRGTVAVSRTQVTSGNGFLHAMPPHVIGALTNSRLGLLAMEVALIAGDPTLTEQIAEMVGDPADAAYIGPDSEICTPDEQSLAYALKAHLLGQHAVAVFYAAGVHNAPMSIHQQAAAVIALVRQDPEAFVDALRGLLTAHAAAASEAKRAPVPRYLMSLPALGLASLGTESGLLGRDRLPKDNAYLPLAMIPAHPRA